MERRIIAFIALIVVSLANGYAAEFWPFAEVNNKLDLSMNAGYHYENKVAAMGFGVTIKGIHLTIGGVGSCKLPEGTTPSGKNTASAMLQVGYQIPVVRSFRIIPVVGFAAVGKIVYDPEGQPIGMNGETDKTRLDMKYHFDAGAHFVFNYRKLIINAAVTRYTVLGGVGIEF